MKQYRYGTQILVLTILSFFLITCDNTPIFFTLEKAYKTSNDRGILCTSKISPMQFVS